MPFRKPTQEDLEKIKSHNLAHPKMDLETRQMLEAFKALVLDDANDYILIEVGPDEERSKIGTGWSNKLKTYLSDDEYMQVKLFSPKEDEKLILLRKVTDAKKKKTNN